MVKLLPADFAVAAARMCELSGVKKTRLSVKLRRKEGRIYLKATDDRATLTSTLSRQSELRLLEGVLSAYVSRCVADAPEEELTAAQAKKAAAAAAAAAATATAAPAVGAAAPAANNNSNSTNKGNASAAQKKGGKGGKKK